MEPNMGLEALDPEIKSQTPHRMSHPGAPDFFFFFLSPFLTSVQRFSAEQITPPVIRTSLPTSRSPSLEYTEHLAAETEDAAHQQPRDNQ